LEGGNGERPCPWVSCKFHLYLDVNPVSGGVKLNFPTLEVDELAETCALDVADRGGAVLEYVGDVMNLTQERIRQYETQAIAHLQESPLIPASSGIFVDDR
jgi:imidazoleglycerol phosphate dehydratase HisB